MIPATVSSTVASGDAVLAVWCDAWLDTRLRLACNAEQMQWLAKRADPSRWGTLTHHHCRGALPR
jgi:hypothetical protein